MERTQEEEEAIHQAEVVQQEGTRPEVLLLAGPHPSEAQQPEASQKLEALLLAGSHQSEAQQPEATQKLEA